MILWNPAPVWCPTCGQDQPVDTAGRCVRCVRDERTAHIARIVHRACQRARLLQHTGRL